MKIRFKIQSFSSQASQHPTSNLIYSHGHWQSERFCDFPQELTLAFYQPALIKTIKIVSHPTKVPTRINILSHLPEHQDKGYERYGYVTFTQPADNNTSSEVKEIHNVNIKATQIRLILVRPFQSKGNFFSQVGLVELQFTGQPIDYVIPASIKKTSSKGFQSQATLLMQLKQSFVKRQQFQQAKQVKEMQSVIQMANQQLFELEKEKQRCVLQQDFEGAKKIKDQLIQLKEKVADLAKKFYDPQGQIRMIKSDVALKKKIEQMNLTPKSNSFKLKQSKKQVNQDLNQPLRDVGQVTSEDEEAHLEEFNQSVISHDQRILPAIINKMKGQTQPILQASEMGDNQFFQSGEKSSVPPEPEVLGPADQANSSLLLQFYEPIFIRKLHSRFWQFRLETITQALQELKTNQNPAFLTKQRIRCYLFIYTTSLKVNSFKTTSTVLEMMDALAQSKSTGQPHQKELHNELQACVKATLKILKDSNQKIRNHAQKTILRMIDSSIFGVYPCYSGLIKGYQEKGIARLKKINIENLVYLVQKYGIGENAVPPSISDFAMKAISDPQAEVRKSAVDLVKAIKAKGGKQKMDNLLSDSRIKSSVVRQLSG